MLYFLILKEDLKGPCIFLKQPSFCMLHIPDVMQTVNNHHWFVSIDSKVVYRVFSFGLAKCVRVVLEPFDDRAYVYSFIWTAGCCVDSPNSRWRARQCWCGNVETVWMKVNYKMSHLNSAWYDTLLSCHMSLLTIRAVFLSELPTYWANSIRQWMYCLAASL